MKDLSFVFHVNTPNNEDVEPLLYKNWLAAADGMGGSGCMRHRVDAKFRSSLAAVLGCVLPEYEKSASHPDIAPLKAFAEGENCYFARIFAPCIRDEVNTSARWASRIVMARFLYCIVAAEGEGECDPDDGKFIDETEKFISRGLVQAKAQLSLRVDNPDMSVLPTTFAALRFLPLSQEKCAVHAVWAGDSRCYVLDAQGLRKLSADDEDESKLLTNHFSADAPARLHCRAYRLKMPFVLLCASDGFFDAYDKSDLTVEAKLLDDIFAASSAEELKNILVSRYENNLSDDTSVAFVPVGFESYEGIRDLLSSRHRQIGALYALHREYAPILSLIDKPEFRVTASVCDRFEMKFADIVRALTQAYYHGKKDVLLTSWWREVIVQSETECRQEFSSRAKERKEQLKQRAAELIEQRGYAACFRKKILHTGWPADHIERFRLASEALEKAREKLTSFASVRECFPVEREELCRSIRAEQRELLSELLSCVNADESEKTAEERLVESRRRCHLTFLLNNLSRIEQYLFYEKLKFNDAEYNGKYKKLIRKAEEYYRHCKKADEEEAKARTECALCEKEYKSALKKVKDQISAILQERRNFLALDFIAELDMDAVMFGQIGREELCERVSEKLVQAYGKDSQMIADTLDVYKSNPAAVSCIDFLFPASKLSDFRKYYRYKDEAHSEKFADYRARLAAYEEETDALLRAPASCEKAEQSAPDGAPAPQTEPAQAGAEDAPAPQDGENKNGGE